MRAARFFVASLSSLVWPLVLVAIPVGITFASARVYAESGAAPRLCGGASFASCADASVGRACACGGGACACTRDTCSAPGGKQTETLSCQNVVACEATDCTGKTTGASCTTAIGDPGQCTTAPCSALDSGTYEPSSQLACGSTAGTSPSPSPTSSPTSTTTTAADDGGCSASPQAPVDALALLASPVAFGLLSLLRRRQPRKAPSARKRS